MSEKNLLSKTSFLKSVQCQKSFFLYKKYYHLRDPLPPEKQAVFNRGHEVGKLAQQLFPGGIDASPTHVFKFAESVVRTKELIAAGQSVIYEAAFVFDDTLVAIDILVKRDEKWYAYEVKSSLKISQAYVMDAALQYYVIKGCLPALEDISLVTFNEEYRLANELEIEKLFKITSVKQDAEKNSDFIKHHIQAARMTYYANELPQINIGAHCFSPYACDFTGTCWKNTQKDNVFEFSGISKKQAEEWMNKGFLHLGEIPDSELSGNLLKTIGAFKTGKEIIEKEKLWAFLSKIKYPLAFMDMEFYTPAIPKYNGKKPFELTPFLFSWKYKKVPDTEASDEYFFHDEDGSPEIPFIEHFLELAGKVNSIIVFDTGQEKMALNGIVKHHPQYKARVEQVKKKLVDLADVFTKLWYYHPLQKGSTSLKRVQQSIFGKDNYADNEVNSGLLASYGYGDYLTEPDPFKKLEKKEKLVAYCQTDTQSLFEIYRYLKKKAIEG